MHRLMVTSAVYRQASRPVNPGWDDETSARAAEIWTQQIKHDPDNKLIGRMRRKRLEGEAIRDAMLAASGSLSRRRGGPGVRPPLPAEVLSTLLDKQWPVTKDERDHRRRSVYLFVRRNLRFPLFDAFDRPDTNASCPERNRSTTAPQALVLLNSELSLDAATRLAGALIASGGPTGLERIRQGYRLALSRLPSAGEMRLALAFLAETEARLKQEGHDPAALALPHPLPPGTDVFEAAALTDLCLAIFNLNEFVYVD